MVLDLIAFMITMINQPGKINNLWAEPRGMLFSCGVGLGFNSFMTAAERGPQVRRGIKPSPRIMKMFYQEGVARFTQLGKK
jgi:hypothetical protein